MTHYASLLCIHFQQIEFLEVEFDKVANILHKLSDEEGNSF
jgi:hypothetical protein